MKTKLADTTILADALLKTSEGARRARHALGDCDVPCYAIMEFRHGPFGNFVYAHNLIAESKALFVTLETLRNLWRQSHKQRTAYEAVAEALKELELMPVGDANEAIAQAAAASGGDRGWGYHLAEHLRVLVQRRIMKALKGLAQYATAAVHPLPCFVERPVVFRTQKRLLEDGPRTCEPTCGLGVLLAPHRDQVVRLRDALVVAGRDPSDRQLAALGFLADHAGTPPSPEQCKSLGDAVFALLCPPGGTVVTTNMKDHEPLARALGKAAERP